MPAADAVPLDPASFDSASFDRLTRLEPAGPGRFIAELPRGWLQGRGLFGGVVAAVLVRALEASAPGRALRSLTAELCGPAAPGRAELHVEVLRVGGAVSTVAARLLQDGQVQAHAVGVLGQARGTVADATNLALAPVEPGDWRALEPLPVGPPLGPEFSQHFEYRTTSLPFSGGRPEVNGWVRPRHPGEPRDAAFLAGCIDAYWPAAYTAMELPRPIATIAFTFQPLADFTGLDALAPLYYRSTVPASRGGYEVEFRELWGHDGRLLALNQQTICVIK